MPSSGKPPWDLAPESSFAAALEWLRKRGGAELAIAIRPQGVFAAAAPGLEPEEAFALLRGCLPELARKLDGLAAAAATPKTCRGRASAERNWDAEEC